MEEAEALATNVAIMGTKMLAKGTLSSLQTEFGGAFHIRALRASGIDKEQAKSLIGIEFDNEALGYTDNHGQISFRVPLDKKMLGKIMKKMELLKGNAEFVDAPSSSKIATKVIDEYTINGPTLEEVFMNVARDNGHSSGVV